MKNQIRLLALGELIIPFLGFFMFEWNLYFIALYYLLDLFCTEIFIWIKIRKVSIFNSEMIPTSKLLYFSFLIILISFISHLLIHLIYDDFDFITEFIEFIKYVEPGFPIPQGYILLPLVFLANYQQYKMLFIFPAKYRTIQSSFILNNRRKALYLLVSFLGIGISVSSFFQLPEIIWLILFAGSKFIYEVRNG